MKSEIEIQKLFQKKFGIRLEEIKEGGNPTPDFFGFKDDEKIFVAELKDVSFILPSEETGYRKEKTGWWSKDDRSPEKIAEKIMDAVKQMKKYELPRIVILKSDYDECDYLDLSEALKGYLDFSDEKGNLSSRNIRFSQTEVFKRLKANLKKVKISLYFWIEKQEIKHCFASDTDKDFFEKFFKQFI
jgi:hypothetical protein